MSGGSLFILYLVIETTVVCPICHAAIGTLCTVPRDGTKGLTGNTCVGWFHKERVELAKGVDNE